MCICLHNMSFITYAVNPLLSVSSTTTLLIGTKAGESCVHVKDKAIAEAV